MVVANESQVGTTETAKSEQTKAALITLLLLLLQSNAKKLLFDVARHSETLRHYSDYHHRQLR